MGWFMCCYYHILLNTDYKNARPLNTPSHITQSANGMGRVWYGGGKHAKQARAHLNRAPTRHAPVQVLTRPLLLVPHGRRRGTSTTTCRASGATQASPCLGADNARSPHASIGPPRCGYIYVCVCVCVYIYACIPLLCCDGGGGSGVQLCEGERLELDGDGVHPDPRGQRSKDA